MIQITKIGTGVIGALLVVGFSLIGYGEYKTNQAVRDSRVVVTKTVVVTPTVQPTATPSVTVKPVLKVGSPEGGIKPLTK